MSIPTPVILDISEWQTPSSINYDKFAKAKSQIVDYLKRKKIKFTEQELDMLIESAVKNMKEGIVAGIVDGEG